MSRGREPAFAEVFGIGGAGKTTLLRRMNERTGPSSRVLIGRPTPPSGIRVALWVLRLWVALLAREPRSAIRLLRSDGGRWLLAKLAYRRATYSRAHASKPIILADAGFLEPFITHGMFHGDDREPPILALLDCLPAPSIVLSVRCDVEVALRRFVNRERELGRSTDPDMTVLAGWFRRAADRVDVLEDRCRATGIETLAIDTTAAPSDADVDQLLRTLTIHLEGSDA